MPKPNWGAGAGGALSGAATGASIGSVVPGIGTAIGGAIGGIAGGLGGLFGGGRKKKKKPKRLSSLDPQQQALYNDYIKSIRGNGPFSDLYDYDAQGANDNFDQNVSRPAYRNFNENIVPSITGQFRSQGLGNSTYAGEALSRTGRDIQENLDAQRSNMQFQGQQGSNANKQNAINSALGLQTFAYSKPEAPTPSGIDQILGSVAPQAGKWFADFLSDSRRSNAPKSVASPLEV